MIYKIDCAMNEKTYSGVLLLDGIGPLNEFFEILDKSYVKFVKNFLRSSISVTRLDHHCDVPYIGGIIALSCVKWRSGFVTNPLLHAEVELESYKSNLSRMIETHDIIVNRKGGWCMLNDCEILTSIEYTHDYKIYEKTLDY